MAPAPALFPPADGGHHTWPKPNFVNPETRDWSASAGVIAMNIVTLAVFAARIWARFRVTKTAGLDDWLIIIAMPGLIGLTISTVLGLRIYGFQLHIWDQTPKTNITVRQITMAIEVIYICTTTLIKLSILCFYRRLTSSAISRRLLIIIWISIFFVAAYGISSTLALIFHCNPVEAYWYRFTTSWLRTHTYKCVDEAAFLLAVISISTAQDFLACMLPMFVVHKLRLPLRQKVALAAIFLTGLAVCAIGALRVHFAHKLVYYTRINPSPTYDITWDAMPSWVATSAEANISLVCASAPALKIYFNKWLNASGVRPRSFGWYKPMGRAGRSSTSGRERGGWTFMKYAAGDPEPDSGYGSVSLQSRVKAESGMCASCAEERREDCGEDISPHEHVTMPCHAHTR